MKEGVRGARRSVVDARDHAVYVTEELFRLISQLEAADDRQWDEAVDMIEELRSLADDMLPLRYANITAYKSVDWRRVEQKRDSGQFT